MILNKFFNMDEKISIYVPATMDVNKEVDNSFFVAYVMHCMSNLFGGCSAMDIVGGYITDAGEYVQENTVICYSYGIDIESRLGSVLRICEYLQTNMKQESIGLEYNGRMYFIDMRENAENAG